MIMSKLKRILSAFNKAPLIIDYIIFAVAAIGCMLAFQGINAESIITGLIYPACGVVVHKIAMEMGFGDEKSRFAAFAATVAMPIGFYCQYILGGTSLSPVLLFMLLGFLFWLKGKSALYVLCFAVAIFLNGIAFPVFVLLLVLKEKRLSHILLNGALLGPAFAILRFLIKLMDSEYRGNLNFSELSVQGPVMPVGVHAVYISVFLAVFIVVCAYVHKVDETKEDQSAWALYFIGLMMFAMFGFGGFSLNELIIMVPFFTLSAFIHKNTKIFMALDILLMLFFVLFAVNEFEGIADETLFLGGIKGNVLGNGIISKLRMKDVLVYKDKDMILSFFSVLLMISAIFKHPRYVNREFKAEAVSGTTGFVRTRFMVGLAIFLIPALVCLVSAFNPPYVTMYTPDACEDIGYMTSGRQNSEVFIATRGKLQKISFMVGAYDRVTDVDLCVRVTDATTEEIIYEEVVNMYNYSGTGTSWVDIDTGGLTLVKGNTYRIDFVCFDAAENNAVTLYRTENLAGFEHGYAFIDLERQDYHLCVKIIEDNLTN